MSTIPQHSSSFRPPPIRISIYASERSILSTNVFLPIDFLKLFDYGPDLSVSLLCFPNWIYRALSLSLSHRILFVPIFLFSFLEAHLLATRYLQRKPRLVGAYHRCCRSYLSRNDEEKRPKLSWRTDIERVVFVKAKEILRGEVREENVLILRTTIRNHPQLPFLPPAFHNFATNSLSYQIGNRAKFLYDALLG